MSSAHNDGAGAAGTLAPSDPPVRLRTSTLRRSCEACRAVKARCVVEPPDSSIGQMRYCKRCLSHGIECLFENAIARPKKLKYTPRTRVKDVEEKIDGLIALISSRREASASTAAQESAAGPAAGLSRPERAAGTASLGDDFFFSNPLNSIAYARYPVPIGLDLDYDEMPFLGNASGSVAAFSAGHSLTSSYGDVIDRGLVQEKLASTLLAKFTTYSEKQFPFVTIPSYASLSYMRRDRPYVLLAILTVTAETALQARLALEFRKVFAQAMLVESRNSLDLLQSILIFCIWHHQYFRPYSSQLYQLSQMAVTMAVDIDLSSTISPTLTSLMAPHNQTLGQRKPSNRTPTQQMANEIERARTFLGTYCVSASIATAHRKPTHFKYDRRMDQACQFLANAREIPSDVHLLPYHVQVRKLAEDVDRVFGNLDQGGISLDARYIETMVKDFERQYEQLRLSMPQQSWDNAALRCAMMYLPVVIYEVALRIPPEHQALLEVTPTTQCCNWCSSPTRLAILMKCIAAAQAYIRCYVDLPENDARHVTVVEVSRHIDAVLILTRAGLGFDTKNFQQGAFAMDRADLLKAADVARYLEASERKMASLVTMTDAVNNNNGGGPSAGSGREERHDLFWQMKQIFQISLDWYNKNVAVAPAAAPQVRQAESLEIVRPDVSPIFWVSEGTTMARARCGVDKTLEGIPHFATNEVNSLIHALSSSVEGGPAAHQPTPGNDLGTAASSGPSGSTSPLVPQTTMSDASTSSAGSDGFASALDPRLGVAGVAGVAVGRGNEAVPSWSADQSAEMFADIPQLSSTSPWFSL